jgi:hypothetical protein
MVVDEWLSGQIMLNEENASQIVDQALEELEEESKKVRALAQEKKYWDAYTRVVFCISFLNIAFQQDPSKQPGIIRRLLDWIQKMKDIVDQIVKGIGGNGYSIGVSGPFGVSISISFAVRG